MINTEKRIQNAFRIAHGERSEVIAVRERF
jgi:hypothetical protein